MNFRYLKSRTDPALFSVLDIYQRSFPLREQMLASFFLKMLADIEAGEQKKRLIVAENDEGIVAGFAFCEMGKSPTDPAYLGYLAVDSAQRGAAVGAQLYKHIAETLFASGVVALVFEIEVVEDVRAYAGDGAALIAERRRRWYQRLGAQAITGVAYQGSTDWQPPMPFTLMVHVAEPPCTSGQALEWARAVLGEEGRIEVVGELGLE